MNLLFYLQKKLQRYIQNFVKIEFFNRLLKMN